MDGRRAGNYTGAVAIATEIVAECTEMVLNGSMDRAHRETVRLWEHRQHSIKALARAELAHLSSAPKFGVYVKQKALLPSVNRWVEQAHARVKSIMDDSPNMGPALPCASQSTSAMFCQTSMRLLVHTELPLFRIWLLRYISRHASKDAAGGSLRLRGAQPV